MPDTILDRTDLHTLLGALADRLRLHGLSAIGMAAQHGGRDSMEHRALSQLGAEMDQEAEALGAVREGLCKDCQLVDAAVRLELGRPT